MKAQMLRLVAIFSATPRHMSPILPLLPSGPGGVHNVSLRGDRKDHHWKRQPNVTKNTSQMLGHLYVTWARFALPSLRLGKRPEKI